MKSDEYTIKKLIRVLTTLPQDAKIQVCADEKRYNFIEMFGNNQTNTVVIGLKKNSIDDFLKNTSEFLEKK